MPPKPKFTREQIVAEALALVSEQGIEHLTARELAKRLGSSPQPLFTVFEDMDELRGEVYAAAGRRLEGFVSDANNFTPAFKQAGMQVILFAMREPKLFQLLFMAENDRSTTFGEMIKSRGGDASGIIDFMMANYDLTLEEARALFQHVWIYTYGIGVLCATKMCTFTDEELVQKVGVDFQAMMMYIKAGRLNEQTPTPHLKSEA
ncbi:MAG: TetR/AcrR family transcriptional regulator [Eggerthellaceae bacterium]|nr:TetR/AcrR family transcriptional regulator [Eggerthellaceae bacterium]